MLKSRLSTVVWLECVSYMHSSGSAELGHLPTHLSSHLDLINKSRTRQAPYIYNMGISAYKMTSTRCRYGGGFGALSLIGACIYRHRIDRVNNGCERRIKPLTCEEAAELRLSDQRKLVMSAGPHVSDQNGPSVIGRSTSPIQRAPHLTCKSNISRRSVSTLCRNSYTLADMIPMNA